ncbi:disulfide bond formation protein DsbD [Kineobactrum sediminis]|uniref:Disulfide bond formation protein DsbD n=1 Tax=Kineobactrum sediminis TaxID=1905677 RepID=A0A2N5XY56_9GAMM|nr:protein-disulfide reductase DsbD [Kineobactrum sediminis]PLW81080.1 disulfide bond formation protein DsbD [Kineobactrum sediminis]
MRFLLASLLWLISSLSLAQLPINGSAAAEFGAPAFLPVEEAYRIEIEPQQNGDVRVYWRIADGYYLYQHSFDFQLHSEGAAIPLTTQLPTALERTDEFFGEVRVYYQEADVRLQPEASAESARLAVKSQGCADAGLCYPPQTEYFDIDFASGSVTPVAGPGSETTVTSRITPPLDLGSLPYMMLLAFLGGSILNLMPCVFPILSLKVLGFARSNNSERLRHGWLYAAGVVTSFLVVATALIMLQQAGQAIGWGFQLQSPGFVIALAYLFLVMGLSLSGMLQLGSGITDIGSGLAARQGGTGSFFTGVLAVVVASPCTAPLMGTALGFAITQPPAIALAVFFALGAGMAAPLVLLSYSTQARNWMPRPGPWMETMKQLLAFPLYGSALWLFWVAGRQTGVDTMAAALAGGLLLALGLWLWNASLWRRALALGCLALAVTLGLWRAPVDDGGNRMLAQGQVPWSMEAIDTLRASGRPVFVDVTADWCITCIANERAVLHTDEISTAFAEHQVTYMIADWTNYDAAIADFLREHGRTGIPLYVLYPAEASAQPVILPQLLTRKIVLEALRATAPKTDVIASRQ